MSEPEERTDKDAVTSSSSTRAQDASALETTAHIVTFQRPKMGETLPTPMRLPVRYDLREAEAGCYLRCIEAPGIGVAVDLSYAFSEAGARKLGERVILLDGAGQFGPLIDSTRQLYNLDHHSGCSRAFTLASCEQALVLVAKGIELDQGDWKICANEPDLDTLFAIWVLLNHRRIREMEPAARDAVTALVRLEGAIDANGFEVSVYCGLPHRTLETTRAQLDRLHEAEQVAKATDGWQGVDLLAYVRDRLIDIDRLVYRIGDFEDLPTVEEELGHVGIGGGRVAVVVRDGAGIYDVEQRLKKVWGDRLGLVALAKTPGHYTLRRVAALADIDLELAYHFLNQLDPEVDGHPPEKRWGGSDEIGGSPRPDGTGLGPRGIIHSLRLAYIPQPLKARLRRMATSLGQCLAAAAALALGFALPGWIRAGTASGAVCLGSAGLVALVVGLFVGLMLARGRMWQLGWRWPAGYDWLLAVPAVLVGALLGGVPVPTAFDWTSASLAVVVSALILFCSGSTAWFAGLAHGLLLRCERIQVIRGRWFVSVPALVAGFGYATVLGALSWLWGLPSSSLLGSLGPGVPWIALVAGALVAGVGAAVIRERSLSLIPASATLVLGGLLRIVLQRLG